jgi:ABC-type dipeptide/oligopeptide/nickel transport system permease subunit
LVVITASNFAAAILIESGLSFFGNWCSATDSQLGHND